jgi:hypothetical protein
MSDMALIATGSVHRSQMTQRAITCRRNGLVKREVLRTKRVGGTSETHVMPALNLTGTLFNRYAKGIQSLEVRLRTRRSGIMAAPIKLRIFLITCLAASANRPIVEAKSTRTAVKAKTE